MPGLRETNKQKTRAAVEAAAERLFLAKGYDDTTVEEIAEAAGVSPRTFFRYYPTKEDVVFAGSDAQIAALVDLIDHHPTDESPLQSLLAAVRRLASDEVGDHASMHAALVATSDALLSRALLRQRDLRNDLIEHLADRMGRTPDDVDVRLAVSQLLTAVTVAVETYPTANRPFAEHLDDVLDRVGSGLSL